MSGKCDLCGEHALECEYSIQTKLKLNYRQEKLMKKSYGKYNGYEIALGKMLLKIMTKKSDQPKNNSK